MDHAKLEALCGRTVTLAGRDMVESESGSGAIDPISIEQRRLKLVEDARELIGMDDPCCSKELLSSLENWLAANEDPVKGNAMLPRLLRSFEAEKVP